MKCRIKQPYEIIQIDKYTGKINTPTLLLMNRSFDIIGKISRYDNWNISLVGNGIDEISFDVHKYADGKICPVWDDLIDLKIVDVSGFGRFEISVNYADSAETVKSIHGLSLETELAQIGLYEFHVNDEEAADMTITEYSKNNYNPEGEFIPTVFYKPDDETHSLLNRTLADKAPHWSIGYVTPYIALDEESQPELSSEFQRTYTVNGDTIYDFLTGTVAQESNVVFIFDTINRRINCYSLCDCIDQETGNVIVHADGTEVTGIGEDTGILVSKNKLADEITISSDKDNVKNCFRIEGGDDVITDMVRAVNMNGSNYIYQFADFQYRDMPKALVDAIEAYNEQFSKEKSAYYGNGDMDKFLNGTLTLCVTSEQEAVIALCVCKNNRIITDHADLSNYEATEYWHIVVSGNSRKLHVSENIKTPYKTVTDAFHTMGLYPKLCVKYDELAYFESAMMPDVNIQETTSKEQYDIMVRKLTDSNMVVGVSSLRNFDNNQLVVSNNVEAMANILIDARYKAEVIKDSVSLHKNEAREYFWRGNIRITKASDQTDCYPKTDDQLKTCFEVKVNDDELTFTRQKIEKALHKGSMLDIDFKIADMHENEIRNYFNRYSLNRLKSFYDGYQACLSILMQADADSTVRKDLYETYYNRMRIVSNPPTEENPHAVPGVLNVRQRQVDRIYSEIADIKDKQTAFQKKWDFKDYLDRHGKDLYKTFCYYRREDAYSNGNYISDGLTDAECLAKAKELVEAAEKEAKKACVLQRTVSTSLHNLFALPEFEPLYDKFALYNYIRIRTEDEILKLRLIGIDFSGDSIETINVTFSEQIESVDGTSSDLQSIIRQAKSMASSYPSTALQAKQGSIANDEIADMYRNGLNAAKTVLANNDNQEVTVNEAGILCRRMKDEGVYDEKQLRITGNMIGFTQNNWQSVELAIGETIFEDPEDPTNTEKKSAYGIVAENIVGKLMASEKVFIGNKNHNVLITGNGITIKNGLIQSANYKAGKAGSMLDLENGTFDFAGGSLTYKNNSLTVKGNVTADRLIATGSGKIANFNISENELYTDNASFENQTGIYFGNKGLKIGNGFKIDENGNLTASGVLNLANGYIAYTPANGLVVKGNIQANNGTFRGTITSTATISGGEISGTKITGGGINGTNITGGNIHGTNIVSDTITAIDKINIRNYDNTKSVTLEVMTSGNTDYLSINKQLFVNKTLTAGAFESYGNILLRKTKDNGNIDFQRITAIYKDNNSHDVITVSDDLLTTSIGWNGTSSYNTVLNLRGKAVKAPNIGGLTVTSDKRLKNSFKTLDAYDDVYMDIEPCAFKYNNGTSGRYHFGVIAQNVKEALEKHGYTTQEFGGFVQMKDSPENEDYCGIDDPMGIIYTEFTMWNTHMIQKLYKITEKQQKKIELLEQKINDLFISIQSERNPCNGKNNYITN